MGPRTENKTGPRTEIKPRLERRSKIINIKSDQVTMRSLVTLYVVLFRLPLKNKLKISRYFCKTEKSDTQVFYMPLTVLE